MSYNKGPENLYFEFKQTIVALKIARDCKDYATITSQRGKLMKLLQAWRLYNTYLFEDKSLQSKLMSIASYAYNLVDFSSEDLKNTIRLVR